MLCSSPRRKYDGIRSVGSDHGVKHSASTTAAPFSDASLLLLVGCRSFLVITTIRLRIIHQHVTSWRTYRRDADKVSQGSRPNAAVEAQPACGCRYQTLWRETSFNGWSPSLTNSRYTHLIITDEKDWPRRLVKRQFTNEDLEKYRRKKIAFVDGADGGDEDAGRSVFSHGRSGKSSALPLILEEDFVDVIKLEASECFEGDVCWAPPLNFIVQTDVFSSLATFVEKKFAHKVHNYLCAIQQDPAVEKYVMDAYGSVSPLCVVEPQCRGCASQDREQRRGGGDTLP